MLILFWQFTIKTLEELDVVSNQHFSIEMFLSRLMYLTSSSSNDNRIKKEELTTSKEEQTIKIDLNNDAISQIKNVTQEKKIKPELQTETKSESNIKINTFNQLLEICNLNKEMKLKYELEKNVNLVRFEPNRIEISFNDNLDKNFVKDLSLKLFEWTGKRWIITFSKSKGELSIKEKEKSRKMESIKKAEETELYKNVLENFSDANLIEVTPNNDD